MMDVDRILSYAVLFFILAFALWCLPSLNRWRRQIKNTDEQQMRWEADNAKTQEHLGREANVLTAHEENQKRMSNLLKRWEELADRAESTLDDLRKNG